MRGRRGNTSAPQMSCDLGALDASERERRALLDEWMQVGLVEVIERPGGYVFWLDPETHIARNVEEFIALERRCCPFLELRVFNDPGHDGPAVEIGGSESIKGFVERHFGLRGSTG